MGPQFVRLLKRLCRASCLAIAVVSPAHALESAARSDDFDAGMKAYRQGALEEAVTRWKSAAGAAEASGKTDERIVALEHLAQAQIALGYYVQAIEALQTAVRLAEATPDHGRTSALLAALGNAHIAIGPAQAAEQYLQRSLGLARGRDQQRAAAVLNDLGNLHLGQAQYEQALAAYRESVALARAAGLRVLAARALANAAAAYRRQGKAAQSDASLQEALAELRQAQESHEAVMTWIQVGLALRELRAQLDAQFNRLTTQAAEALNTAAAIANRIGDVRGLSYAWGYLGALYEDERRYAEALQLTRRAIFSAQQVNAPESLYRWQWQAGRLLKSTGATDESIAAYRRAVHTLQSIRREFSVGYGTPRGSFRDTVGRVYFQLVDLLLQRSAAAAEPQQVNSLLLEARETVELFKVAELRDYFRDECVETALAKATALDAVAHSAAVIYPILLADRIELLITLPGGLKRIALPVTGAALSAEVRRFRVALEKRTTWEFLPSAQQLYRWLIAPVEPELAALKIDTLVFVPDGALRTVPMSALHDGERFLVEKYAIGITPGLNLTDPRPIEREKLRVLALGITEPVQGFPALINVSTELQSLRALFDSTTLVNEEFRLAAMERELKNGAFTVLHIASHGEFSSDVTNTFLLAFDDRLTMDRLDQLVGLLKFRKEPLELLTLSACDTAIGDDRAALGLAGVAIKAGARSAVATLWNINDEVSSKLVAQFYRELKEPSVSRASALRRAQLSVLSNPRYDHPGFWAPFLLINNWL